jgi:hypothetical protein
LNKPSPERTAWTILLCAFAAFCLLLIALPLGTRYYLHNASRNQEAELKTLRGTAVIEDPRAGVEKPVGKGDSTLLPKGASINVDETARASLSFFDNSFLVLYPGTRLELLEMYGPRFNAGLEPNTIVLNHKGGGIRVDTVNAQKTPLHFEVRSPHLDLVALLQDDGSYTIQVSNDRAEIIVHRGRAWVTAHGVTVALNPRERTSVRVGETPQSAIAAARNIVTNDDFSESLATGWRVFNDQGADGGTTDGSATLTQSEGRRAIHFVRTGGQFNHCETILDQDVNYVMPEPPASLVVRAVVKVSYQSLSGGGYQSSEYPLMIRLTYQDAFGSQNDWVQGFYYQNVDGNPTMYGVEVPQNQWYLFESDDLLKVFPIVPSRIVRLRVFASGWNYDSMVSQVSVIIE